MARVMVDLGAARYDVRIEAGLIDRCGPILAEHAPRGRIALITDENVAAHILPRIEAAAAAHDIALHVFTMPVGEIAKSWDNLGALLDGLLALGLERGEPLLALGGGVVGDLTGFAAAILKRGTRFIQVPTSLLAQVDSSVGGKTGINSAHGKNLIGAFHQPAVVLIDPDTLRTLPDRHMRAGFAEVIKYGLINDAAFFDQCAAQADAILARDPAALEQAIAHSVQSKANIVAADERETKNVRALLNLGHTFGHALEAETGFSDRMYHGEAVAAGMALAFRFSAARGLCSPADATRVTEFLAHCGLPTGLQGVNATGAALIDHMRHDKKMASGTLPFILARGIGAAFVDSSVALDDVAAFLDRETR